MIGKETAFSQRDLKVTNVSGVAGGTYSTVANIPKAVRVKLVAEGKQLIGGAKKAKQIWNSMRKADFRKEGILNETNIDLVFDKNKEIIYDLLKVQNARDFIELFDVDRDGYLNEDEQVLVFTIIKEKIQFFAQSLSAMHEYEMFKDLMKEVRSLEEDIVKFQDEMRTNIQNNQLHDYIKIGDDKLKEFYQMWEEKFKQFEEESLNRIEDLKATHESQMQFLNQKLERAVEMLKIKPTAKLKEMQVQEKMVALNERIQQAQNYRRELKILEVKEAQRVQTLRNANADKQRRQLLSKQKKEMLQLEAKIENQRNNMKIKMEKDLDVLQKQINLHVNDIKRIQGLIKRLAIKKGLNADEIRRLKEKARNTQNYIKQTKAVESTIKPPPKAGGAMSGSVGLSGTMGVHATTRGGAGATAGFDQSLIGSNPFLFQNLKRGGALTSLSNTYSSNPALLNIIMPIRQIILDGKLTTFDIASESENDKKGVNQDENGKGQGGLREKIKNLLDQRKPPSEKLPSLVDQYDDDLNPIQN